MHIYRETWTLSWFRVKRHQYKNSECGVYSMNFIIRLLNGESFKNITENKTLDDPMNRCRDKYFTLSKPFDKL